MRNSGFSLGLPLTCLAVSIVLYHRVSSARTFGFGTVRIALVVVPVDLQPAGLSAPCWLILLEL